MTSAKQGQFRLPRVKWSKHGVSLLSLRQGALEILGQYTPGDGPVVVDPRWTKAAVPEAIAMHETIHQFLYKNTAVGAFTQLLLFILERNSTHGNRPHSVAAGFAHEVVPACFEIQWCVQELAATYTELSAVARSNPGLLEQEIRGLPSGRLDQPPYREAFDAMDRLLPVRSDIAKERSMAQSTLVSLLAAASMNSDCLVRMAEVKEHTSKALLSCIADRPDSRFERIVNHLDANGLLELLLEEVQSFPPERVYKRIVAEAPRMPIFGDSDLVEQIHRANQTWSDFTQVNVGKERPAAESLPSIVESRVREQQQLAANPVQELPVDQFRERLVHTERKALGLILELWLRDSSQAYVAARPYFLDKDNAPFPGTDDSEPEALPADLAGLMSTSEVLRELAAFPALPQIVVFGDDSWRRWDKIPNARARFDSCVRVCRQTDLTPEYVLYLLGFVQSGHDVPRVIVNDFRSGAKFPSEFMGKGVEVVVLKLKSGGLVGCLFSRSEPKRYGLQKLHTEFAMQLFLEICERLGIASSADGPTGQFVNLLSMVSLDFYF